MTTPTREQVGQEAFEKWASTQGFTASDLAGPLHELEGCWNAAQTAIMGNRQMFAIKIFDIDLAFDL